MKAKILLPFLLFSTFTFSQNYSEILNWFDTVTGENLFISSGIKTIDGYPVMRGQHPFLLEDKFYQSELKYNNQVFNELINYNIYKDELILLTPNAERSKVTLSKNKVDYFYLLNRKFIYLKKYGFCEVLLEKTDRTLYKKHEKKIIGRVNNLVAFKKKESILLSRNNNYSTIKSKSDWMKVFPNKISEIKSYYSNNSDKLKNNPKKFTEDLLNYLIK